MFSFASESLAQSTASFPTAPTSVPVPAPPPAPAPVPAPARVPAAVPPPARPPAPPPAKPAPPAPAPTPKLAPLAPLATEPAPKADGGPKLPPDTAMPFYPALLPYSSGLPVPPGYRVEHRAATGIIIGGLATLGIAYSTALVLGASSNFGDGTGWVAIPVIGPWAAIGARSYHCSNDPLQANQCISGAFSEVQTIAVLSADGVIQAAGAVLFVVGLASGHDELVRTDLPVSFRVLPRTVGADGVGIGLDGRF
ncbi:MAG TPA: hypothetical protein VER12_18615 [Polyangiaceae bacterium]|nr:hypothetical protein [Polyangiaceae bacterium]